MISRIRGNLTRVNNGLALVEKEGVFYEIMLPSALAERLKEDGKIGGEVTLETIHYIEAGDKKSNYYPKLVGFTSSIDREFFSLLIQVSGLGIKKALKSLVIPIKDIATAIETKDTAQLNRLPGVGARLSEKIVAELHGKVTKFALSRETAPLSKREQLSTKRLIAEPLVGEAREVLLQLQYTRSEAEQMIETALKAKPEVNKVEDLITVIFNNERQRKVPQ